MPNVLEPLVLVIFLAVLLEVLIEAVKPLVDPVFSALPLPESVEPYLYISALLGILAALGYSADMLSALGLAPPNAGVSIAATIGTGLIIGRGANFAHDAITRLATAE